MNKEKIIELKTFIEYLGTIDENIRLKREIFEEKNREIFEEQEKAREAIRTSKAMLSDDAIVDFQKTGEKKLMGGIGIRVGTDIIYEDKDAFQWAVNHALCLSLDKKAFEKIAKTQDIEFVKKEERVKVTFQHIRLIQRITGFIRKYQVQI